MQVVQGVECSSSGGLQGAHVPKHYARELKPSAGLEAPPPPPRPRALRTSLANRVPPPVPGKHEEVTGEETSDAPPKPPPRPTSFFPLPAANVDLTMLASPKVTRAPPNQSEEVGSKNKYLGDYMERKRRLQNKPPPPPPIAAQTAAPSPLSRMSHRKSPSCDSGMLIMNRSPRVPRSPKRPLPPPPIGTPIVEPAAPPSPVQMKNLVRHQSQPLVLTEKMNGLINQLQQQSHEQNQIMDGNEQSSFSSGSVGSSGSGGGERLSPKASTLQGVGPNIGPKKVLVRARESYSSGESGHLSFDEGQVIELFPDEANVQADENGVVLWKGRAIVGGRECMGLFPSDKVAFMKSRLNSMSNAKPIGSKEAREESNKTCISPAYLKMENRCNKLFYAVTELVDTEFRHVNDLSTVLEVFVLPFQETFGPALTRQIFSDWAPLLRVHEKVLCKLRTALPSINFLGETFAHIVNDPNLLNYIRKEKEEERRHTSRESDGAPDSFMSEMELTSVQTHLSTLAEVHKQHLSDFVFLDNAQIKTWCGILEDMTTEVCNVMIEMSDWLKLCIPCVVNQPTAMKTLKRSRETGIVPSTSALTSAGPQGVGVANSTTILPRAFVEQQAIKHRDKVSNLDLASFLIKPMQRITKYPLLMREIVKHNDDVEVKALASETFEKMSRIAANVNDIMKQHQGMQNSKRAADLCAQLRPQETVDRLGLGPNSRNRKLYRLGKVAFQTLTTNVSSSSVAPDSSLAPTQLAKTDEVRNGACYAMLFTSALIITLKSLNKWKTKTKYHIVKVIEVGNIKTVESMEGCLAVRTACSVLLLTPLEGDVLDWLVDIQECQRVMAADRERQDVAQAQMKRRQVGGGMGKEDRKLRTRSVDLNSTRGNYSGIRKAPVVPKVTREEFAKMQSSFIEELKGHSRFTSLTTN